MVHVVLVSFPAQGHINPTLQLAKLLAKRGIQATFVTTTHAHVDISATATFAARGVAFAPIYDGYDSPPPTVTSATYCLQLHQHGSRSLAHLIQSFTASGRPVDCIVYNFLLPWVADVASGHGVPSALLWIQANALLSIYHHFLCEAPHLLNDIPNQLTLPGLPSLNTDDLPSFIFPDNAFPEVRHLVSKMFRVIKEKKSKWVLVNSFEELEETVIASLNQLQINPIAIGPLVPSAFVDIDRNPDDTTFGADLSNHSPDHENSSYDQISQWLADKTESSVVYVSFGTMASLPAAQIDEIANGLASSGHYFIWVVRPPSDYGGFPSGFSEAAAKRGMVARWVSQVELLAHRSIGCFVTHAGWNSILEGLVNGKSMVCAPQWSDQPTNSWLVTHAWGAGTRVRMVGSLMEGEDLRKCISMVMEGESGKQMRENAERWRESARAAARIGGLSDRNIQTFIDELRATHGGDQEVVAVRNSNCLAHMNIPVPTLN